MVCPTGPYQETGLEIGLPPGGTSTSSSSSNSKGKSKGKGKKGHEDHHHRHHNVYDRAGWSKRLNDTLSMFQSEASKQFIGELAARDCGGETVGFVVGSRPHARMLNALAEVEAVRRAMLDEL